MNKAGTGNGNLGISADITRKPRPDPPMKYKVFGWAYRIYLTLHSSSACNSMFCDGRVNFNLVRSISSTLPK
jgi:hypothetical protein